MIKLFLSVFVALNLLVFTPAGESLAVTATITSEVSPTVEVTPSPLPSITPTAVPKPDLTEKSKETIEPLRQILEEQKLGPVLPFNFMKYAIRYSVWGGVAPNTIVLLLLLPLIASIIAASRHLIGIRGFGIFLPAALSVVFLATGPIVGILLFLIIVTAATLTRMFLRKVKIKLQYLPRMAIILWVVSVVVMGTLFISPLIKYSELGNVSIFAVLILALVMEDFIRVQLGKSIKTAIDLTTETLILGLISYAFMILQPIQKFALLNPEVFLLGVLAFDLILGRYVGLRLLEIWRFRKLVRS